jgi:pyrroloquinoline quinone biosynthesis protein D
MIAEESVPAFAPGVKLRFDQAREAWVLLAPERMFELDETGVEILKLVDGQRSAGAAADDLAARFQAPREMILADVVAFLQEFADRGVIRDRAQP